MLDILQWNYNASHSLLILWMCSSVTSFLNLSAVLSINACGLLFWGCCALCLSLFSSSYSKGPVRVLGDFIPSAIPFAEGHPYPTDLVDIFLFDLFPSATCQSDVHSCSPKSCAWKVQLDVLVHFLRNDSMWVDSPGRRFRLHLPIQYAPACADRPDAHEMTSPIHGVLTRYKDVADICRILKRRAVRS